MKRFLFTAALISAIIGVMLYCFPKSMSSDVNSYSRYDATVNVYCRSTSADSIDLGLGRQVTCTLAELKSTLASCSGVDGISVSFNGSMQDVEAVICRLRAKQISFQQLDGTFVACFFSNSIRERVTIDGEPVNVQIAYRNGIVTIGYPLILGSY